MSRPLFRASYTPRRSRATGAAAGDVGRRDDGIPDWTAAGISRIMNEALGATPQEP